MPMRSHAIVCFLLAALLAAACTAAPVPSPAPLPTRTALPAPSPTATAQPAPTPAAHSDAQAMQAELAKFDNPQDHLPASGPAGTAWDRQYRSFIQTDADATSKGLPTHAQAAQQITADAATGNDRLQQHKDWILYIKHYSQAYRPAPATDDLQQLYAGLIGMEFGATAAAAPEADSSSARILRDIPYGADDPLQRLDAYLVGSSTPSAVVVEIHGGGWRRGQKSQFAETYTGDLINMILRSGISVVSIDYRLTPQWQHPAQVQDAARAIQFVRSKAAEWNVDAQRIAAMGGSAGAHVAAWVALHDDMAAPYGRDAVARQSTRLSCFVDMWGPMDLTRADPLALSKETLRGEDFANAYTALFGTTLQAYRTDGAVVARQKDASPLFYVTPDDPPAFILTAASAEIGGAAHPPVPDIISDPHSPWHGVLLADRMSAAGVAVSRYIGPQVGKDVDKDAEAIVAFLQRCLGE